VSNWISAFPGRNKYHDEMIRLMVWDLVGTALDLAEWKRSVSLLMGQEETQRNLFTATLFRNVLHTPELFQQIGFLLQGITSEDVAGDTLKEWFEGQLADWIALVAAGQHKGNLSSQTFSELVHNTYALVFWEHVARVFQRWS
jgi:hypothetical protein